MNKEKGFIKTIVLIIIALAALKIAWEFDILDFVKDNPGVQTIIDSFMNFMKAIWNFIKPAFSFFS